MWASTAGYTSERDLFIARAVLQYLCLSNIKDANIVFKIFNESMCLDSPLINFLSFLLKTLEREAYPLFKKLRESYAISLARDDTFDKYLDLIGKIYFGVEPPKQGGMAGMLGSLLKGFMDS